jgi:hypothetical protein
MRKPFFLISLTIFGIHSAYAMDVSNPKPMDIIKVAHNSQLTLNNSIVENETVCLICKENMQDPSLTTTLDCFNTHSFHTACLRSWINMRTLPTCPICFSQIPEKQLKAFNAINKENDYFLKVIERSAIPAMLLAFLLLLFNSYLP